MIDERTIILVINYKHLQIFIVYINNTIIILHEE